MFSCVQQLPWLRFIATFFIAAFITGALLVGLIVVVDPYGLRVRAGDAPQPIMDINQRFMYPQLARSHRYNAAVFGTSTMRLLDPNELNDLFRNVSGGARDIRFANLAMNAATPWEQMQLAQLFMRNNPAPEALIFGLDMTWCDVEADTPAKQLTFRAFPERFYDADPLNDWGDSLNLKTLEIAFRLISHSLDMQPESLRADGYGVFVPPDQFYDAERAREHIWQGKPPVLAEHIPAEQPTPEEQASWRFPALAWLDDMLVSVPDSTRVMLVFPPIHASTQPVPGSVAQVRDNACKQQFAELAARRNASLIDYRHYSSLTRDDTNYWDPLHYRLPIASRIARALAATALAEQDGGKPHPVDDTYSIMQLRRAPNPLSSGQ